MRAPMPRAERLPAPARVETTRAGMEMVPNAGVLGFYGSAEAGRVTMLHPGERFGLPGTAGREVFGPAPISLPDGFTRPVGRTKRMIIPGGEKIHPAEREVEPGAHPGVRDDGVASAEYLTGWCRSWLAGYKRPCAILHRRPRHRLARRDA